MKPDTNLKGANKDVTIYVESSATKQNVLFWTHLYVRITKLKRRYWLVAQTEVPRFVHGQGKKENKGTSQRILLSISSV